MKLKSIYDYRSKYIKQWGSYRLDLEFRIKDNRVLELYSKDLEKVIAIGRIKTDKYLKINEMEIVDRWESS